MDEKIFLNGDFISRANAKISIMDRGFLFGDGVYELIPVYNSKPFLLDRHLKRLTNSLVLINMNVDLSSIVDIKDVIENLIKLNHNSNFYVYIHISRGIQDNRNHIYRLLNLFLNNMRLLSNTCSMLLTIFNLFVD